MRAHFSRLVAILLVPVLLLAGLSATTVPVPARTDPGLAAFLAVGGEISDICGSGHSPGTPHCDACRIVGPAILPTPSGDWHPVRLAATFATVDAHRADATRLQRKTGFTSRAPPLPA